MSIKITADSKFAFICSPYRGKTEAEIEAHVDYAMDLTRTAFEMGYVPVVPHLMYPGALDDDVQDERAAGIYAGHRLMEACEHIIVGLDYGISAGMTADIAQAQELGLTQTQLWLMAAQEVGEA